VKGSSPSAITVDGPGHDAGKEAHEDEKSGQVATGGNLPPLHVEQVAQDAERVEAQAQRHHQTKRIDRQAPAGPLCGGRQLLREAAAVFEQQEYAQVDEEADERPAPPGLG
jgi:hypothetical protein